MILKLDGIQAQSLRDIGLNPEQILARVLAQSPNIKATLYAMGNGENMTGRVCYHWNSGTSFLETSDPHDLALTLDACGVLRLESYADMIRRFERDDPIERVTAQWLDGARMSAMRSFLAMGIESQRAVIARIGIIDCDDEALSMILTAARQIER